MSRLFLTVTVFLSAFFMVEGLAAQKKSYLPILEIGKEWTYNVYGKYLHHPAEPWGMKATEIVEEDGHQVFVRYHTGIDFDSIRPEVQCMYTSKEYEEDGVLWWYSYEHQMYVPMVDFNLEVGDVVDDWCEVVWKGPVVIEGIERCLIALQPYGASMGYYAYWCEGIGAIDDIYMTSLPAHIGESVRMTECWQGDTCLFRYDDMENYISEVRSIIGENPDAPLYDLYGRRIVAPVPGQLYIRNGRKHIAR